VLLVITRPATGRNREASPLQQAGEFLGLEVWAPETVNAAEPQRRIALLAADLLVVCDYGEILRPETLATTRLGGINLHGSLLPKYRGAAPVQWAVLNGDAETGNTIIQMTPGLDAGPCLLQQRTAIDPDEDAGALERRLSELGADGVLSVVDELEAGMARPVVQDQALASKAPRLKKEQGAIDWSRPAQMIKDQVRGLRPWPRAYTFWHRAGADPMRLNIDRVSLPVEVDVVDDATQMAPAGTVVEASGRLLLQAADRPLPILEVQPAGKRAMSAAEFLRGNRVTVGDRFAAG
jgi:methionyl-tRNA formyltransferase